MNADQYNALTQQKLISVDDLQDKSPRTLIYGYTAGGQTFHLYLTEDGNICRLMHLSRTKNEKLRVTAFSIGPSAEVQSNEEFVPHKRVYPESCDWEFCTLLRNAGVNIPFTTFDPSSDQRRQSHFGSYRGEIYDTVDSEIYESADQILNDVASGHRVSLLQEASAAVGVDCETCEEGAYAPARRAPALRSKVKSMLLDSGLAQALNHRGAIEPAFLCSSAFNFRSYEVDVRRSDRDGGTIKTEVYMSEENDMLALALDCAAKNGDDHQVLQDPAGKSQQCAVFSKDSDGKYTGCVTFHTSMNNCAMVWERLFGTEAVFLERIEKWLQFPIPHTVVLTR